MNISGALVLAISIGILLFVGINATSGIYEDADINESNPMYESIEGAQEVTGTTFSIFGYIIMAVLVFGVIKAFGLA